MVLLLLFLSGCIVGTTISAPIEYYATKYDHIDVEAILNNRRMVNYYSACLLSKGPCPPDGLEFKRILPDALKTNCIRCTEKQKTVTLRTIKRLKKEYPKIWAQLQAQWDPEDIYVKLFEATYGDRWQEPVPKPSVQIGNRFGEDDDSNNEISSPATKPPKKPIKPAHVTGMDGLSTTTPNKKDNKNIVTPRPTSTISPVTANMKTVKTTVASITSTLSLLSSTTISPKKTTKTPTVTTILTASTSAITSTRAPPIRVPIVPNIGAGIQATVSFGTNIVGNFIRGLGALGTRVAATGADIADVVVKNFSRPL